MQSWKSFGQNLPPPAPPSQAAQVGALLLEVLIVVVDGHILRISELLLVLRDEGVVDLDLWSLGELSNELEVALVRQSSGQPEEGLLEVVVAPGAEVIVLQVPLSVELDVLCLNLAVLHINLVPNKDDGNVLAHPHNVAMPIGHVLVCDAGRHVEHDDGTLTLNVVAITQTAELLLAGSVPNVEGQRPTIRGESQWVHLDT